MRIYVYRLGVDRVAEVLKTACCEVGCDPLSAAATPLSRPHRWPEGAVEGYYLLMYIS